MEIFWRLVLAHLLADFTFQTDFIAGWKRKNILGGLAHSLIFLVCSGILCYGYLNDVWISIGNQIFVSGWIALLLLTVFHFLEDEWRIWTIEKLNSSDSIVFFLWDQFIHLVLIFVFIPREAGGFFPVKWISLAIIFVLTTHFTSVFTYYFEKDILGHAKLLAKEKYQSMLERIVTILTLLLPGPAAFAVLILWLARVFVYHSKHDHEFSWIDVIIGNLMAALFGIIARNVYYS